MGGKVKHVLRVMEIERFAIHDGPGIRTVVFLQGCPLFCPWCANPESQGIKKQLLYVESKCVKCKKCVSHCPKDAIDVVDNRLVFNRDVCGECQICGEVCPQHAIRFSGIPKSIDEILSEVMKDEDYYQESKGGLTISGGEPFVQYEGFLALIKAGKNKGLHIAVETTGNIDINKIIEAEPYIDLFLFDVKHIDKMKLQEVTGADLDKIIKNLAYIAAKNPNKIIMRVPVIPTFNYEDETIEEILEMAAKYHVKEVHLLPYHTLGKNKYDQIGKQYTFVHSKMLDKKALDQYICIGEKKGVKVVVGG
jgi:pyruvate formate lyase activating enzyme